MDIEADILEIDALVEKAKQAQAVYEAQGSKKPLIWPVRRWHGR